MVKDLTGQKFCRLIVIKRVLTQKGNGAIWECLCDCGKRTNALSYELTSGHKRSCGCLRKDSVSKIQRDRAIFNVPDTAKFKQDIRRVYFGMRQRCYNPNNAEYERYGGRGISICADWNTDGNSFYQWAIMNGYQKGLTIDRIDNNKGYSPDNCRWVTRAEQNRNTSRNNKVLDANGKTYTTAEVAKIIGVSRSTAAKWFREEGLRTLSHFTDRYKRIVNYNAGRTIKCRTTA